MPTLTFEEDEDYKTEAWKQKMSANGDILKNNNVRQILLVHGTFVGNDALGFFDLLKNYVYKRLVNTLRKRGKALINQLLDDVGNYTPRYAATLGEATGIPCELFLWDSGNFHYARLKGAIELAKNLEKTISENEIVGDERILVLGHSHAGQLFALLTTFLAADEESQGLYNIMEKYDDLKEDKKNLINNLKIIKKSNLDFVTFGTPVRYSWGEYPKFRLMAVVNYRSSVRLSGLYSTRDGDYVQQWALEGSDAPPLPPEIIEANDEFDSVLDKGRDISLLISHITREERREPRYASGDSVNETFLVNYKDNSRFPIFFLNPFNMPHCVKTLFGHGIYTKNETMLFNMNIIIINNWYKKSN